jgi:hypothetical protein
LWNQYFNYLKSVLDNNITIENKLVIFAHNLGNFDGYFLYKGLMSCFNPENISSIIDDKKHLFQFGRYSLLNLTLSLVFLIDILIFLYCNT